MGTVISRAALFVVCLAAGALSGPGFTSKVWAPFEGAALGALACLVAYWLEAWIRRSQPLSVLGALGGALLGALGALIVQGPLGTSALPRAAGVGVGAILVYLGGVAGARGLRVVKAGAGKAGVSSSSNPKVLDTSAIIDGRIADMVELGFVGGPLVVPQFILNEVQGIADSSDTVKRGRGRRGLAILEKLQNLDGVETRITDQDFPQVKEVDRKLVALAKGTGATVVTNDFNLAKVAELQGVRVLNVHQLAHALRPVVLPGEEVEITLQKPGKEPGQGVGYLEDGTMVVVDGGGARLGETVRVSVTSVLQTSAGRLIFAKPNGGEGAAAPAKRSVWRRQS